MSFKNYVNVYEFPCTLPGNGQEVMFKPLTTRQIKKLLVYDDESDILQIVNALNDLVSSSITTEGFNIGELYLKDRLNLLIEIRKKTKGETFEFQFKCPDCGSQSFNTLDLDSLETKEKDNELGKIQVNDDISIEIDHIKVSDEKEVIKSIDKKLSDNEKNFEYQINLLASSIKSVIHPDGKDENIPFEDKTFLVNNTPNNLLQDIGNWLSDNWFGIWFETEYSCNSCSYKETKEIPTNQLFI